MPTIPRNFLSSESGSLVPIFVIALVPMIAAVGMSVDYTSAVTTKASMQSALDAAALSITTLPRDMAKPDRQQKLREAFVANGGEGSPTLIDYTVDSDGTAHLSASASYSMPTNFMQIASINNVPIGVATKVNKTPTLVEATFKVSKVSGYWDKTMTLYGTPFGGSTAQPLMQITYTYKEFKSSSGVPEPKGYGSSVVGIPDGTDALGKVKYKPVQTLDCQTQTVDSLNNLPAGAIPGTGSYKDSRNRTVYVYFSTTCASTMIPPSGKGAVIDVSQMDKLNLEMKVTTGTTGTFKSNDATTSNRLYIGDPDIQNNLPIEVATGKIVDIFSAVPCGKTSNQAWEDGGNSPPSPDVTNADFFYNVTGKCNFSQRVSETVVTQ